jgi:hypothetical protein
MILYRNRSISSKEEGALQMKIFAITNHQNIHKMKINLICTMNNFRKLQVSDFENETDLETREEVVFTIWNDKIVSKTYLNANNFSIN